MKKDGPAFGFILYSVMSLSSPAVVSISAERPRAAGISGLGLLVSTTIYTKYNSKAFIFKHHFSN